MPFRTTVASAPLLTATLLLTPHGVGAQESRVGAFTVSVERDVFNENSSWASVESLDEGLGKALLRWKCSGGEAQLQFISARSLGALWTESFQFEFESVQYQFGNTPPSRLEDWAVFGRDSLRATSQTNAAFTTAALNAETVVVSAFTINGVITYTFPLGQLQGALARLGCAIARQRPVSTASDPEVVPPIVRSSSLLREMSRNYPPLMSERGEAGTVTVRIRVSESGRVDPESILVEHSTHEALVDAGRRVAERLRFLPALRAGVEVPFEMTIPLHFRLLQPDPPMRIRSPRS